MAISRFTNVLVCIAGFLLLTYLFAQANTVDTAHSGRVDHALSNLKQVDGQLNQEVIKSAAQLLPNYDPLVRTIDETRATLAKLKSGPDAIYRTGDGELDRQIDALTEALADKAQLVERFKSHHAVYRNSLNYFPYAIRNLITEVRNRPGAEVLTSLLESFSRDTLSFNLTPDPILRKAVKHDILRLRRLLRNDPELGKHIDMLITHSETILREKDQGTRLIHQIVASPTTGLIANITGIFAADLKYRLDVAAIYRTYLYVVALLLMGYVAYVVVQMRRTAVKLQDALINLEYQKFALDQHAIVAITDPDGRITYANDKFTEISQYSREELIGQDHRIVNSGHHPKAFFKNMWDTIKQGKVWKGEVKNRNKSGEERWFSTTIVPFPGADGQPYQYAAIRTDITERKRAEEQRNQYANTLQAIMDHAPFGIWLTDTEGRPKFVNETFCTEVGMPMAEVLAEEYIGDLFDENVRAEFFAGKGRGLDTDRQRTLYTSMHVPHKGPRDFKITRVNVREDGASLSGFIGIIEDVTETRKLQEEITHQATHDALTGLLNRSAFEHKLDQICQTIGPLDTPHALAYIDLDQFKIVNDTCGHHAGDELLRQLTTLYTKQMRKTELVDGPDGPRLEPALARLGGDEFGLLLYNCPVEDAIEVAERMIDTTKSFRFSYEGQQFSVGCSIGLVEIHADNDGAAQFMRQADNACYVAKEKGRGRIHMYEPDDEDVQERQGAAQWAPRITNAIENDRLELFCQTIAPVSRDKAGDRFEILVRYRSSSGDRGSRQAPFCRQRNVFR